MADTEFQNEWKRQFGLEPPDWITSVQDVATEISKSEDRIEQLRLKLRKELFILEWLKTKAENESSVVLQEVSVSETLCSVTNEEPAWTAQGSKPFSTGENHSAAGESGDTISLEAGRKQEGRSTERDISALEPRERSVCRVSSGDVEVLNLVRIKLVEKKTNLGRSAGDLGQDSGEPQTFEMFGQRSMSDASTKSRKVKTSSSSHDTSPSRRPSNHSGSDTPDSLKKGAVKMGTRIPSADAVDPLLCGIVARELRKGSSMYSDQDPQKEWVSCASETAGPQSSAGTAQESGGQGTPQQQSGALETTTSSRPAPMAANDCASSPSVVDGEGGEVVTKRPPRAHHQMMRPRSIRNSQLSEEDCKTPKAEEEEEDALLGNHLADDLLCREEEKDEEGEEPGGHDTLGAADSSVTTLVGGGEYPANDPQGSPDADQLGTGVGKSTSEPSLVDTDSLEMEDEMSLSELLRSTMFGSRCNSASSLVDSLSEGHGDASVSPTHQVSMRPSSANSKRRPKGQDVMESQRVQDMEGQRRLRDLLSGLADPSSPRSMSPGSMDSPTGGVMSFSIAQDQAEVRQESPSSDPDQQPVLGSATRTSRLYPVRRNTVVHGEVLVIRKLVVAGIVSAEKSYIDGLTVMKELYRKPLIALAPGSQPILSERDINTIFYRVDDLHGTHFSLHEKLEPKLQNWSMDTCVGEFFVELCRNLKLYKDYVEMYRKSQECLDRCRQESAGFRKYLDDVRYTVVSQYKDIPNINELLRKPIERLQSYSLVLNDLCQHTPESHHDFRVLKESFQAMSAFIASTHDPRAFRELSGGFNRELVHEGPVVELVEGQRKIRRLFLFHDILVSAKQRIVKNGGMKFEPKWYLYLSDISFHPSDETPDARQPVPVTSDMELSVMKNRMAEIKAQMTRESKEKRMSTIEKEKDHASMKRNALTLGPARGGRVEKLKKKLEDQQVSFWVASPSLPLRVFGPGGKKYMFLLHNEEEREGWILSIKKHQPKCVSTMSIPLYELQDLLSRQVITDEKKPGELIVLADEDYLSGVLKIRISCATNLKAKPAGLYCALELDEYGRLDRKARTTPTSFDPVKSAASWDEDFEVEATGTHLMRVLVCSKSLLKEEICGHGKIRLPVSELKSNKRHKFDIHLHPQGSVSLVVEYFSSLSPVGRKPSLLSSGVFGFPLETVAKRERHEIPLIVQTCIDEVERRGMDEVGIYRVAGVLRDVTELRQAFDTDYLKAQVIASDTDIHAVAGLLKRYFRELPDPLFTDELYVSFVHGLGLSDPEARNQCLVTLLYALPPVNYKTAIFLFRHLRRVAQQSATNKMTLPNLATVFGPNLLRPADTSDSISHAALDVRTPVSVLLYFLNCPDDFFDESVIGSSPHQTGSSSGMRSKEKRDRKKLAMMEEEMETSAYPTQGERRESVI
ncbi:hypothetical protein EMCRGX_G024828 [Ephydatia muelleri]